MLAPTLYIIKQTDKANELSEEYGIQLVGKKVKLMDNLPSRAYLIDKEGKAYGPILGLTAGDLENAARVMMAQNIEPDLPYWLKANYGG